MNKPSNAIITYRGMLIASLANFLQPCPQANLRYATERRRPGTKQDGRQTGKQIAASQVNCHNKLGG